MPYAPGIEYRGDQYTFMGLQGLGQGIQKGVLEAVTRADEQQKEMMVLNAAMQQANQAGFASQDRLNEFHAGNLAKKREIASKAIGQMQWKLQQEKSEQEAAQTAMFKAHAALFQQQAEPFVPGQPTPIFDPNTGQVIGFQAQTSRGQYQILQPAGIKQETAKEKAQREEAEARTAQIKATTAAAPVAGAEKSLVAQQRTFNNQLAANKTDEAALMNPTQQRGLYVDENGEFQFADPAHPPTHIAHKVPEKKAKIEDVRKLPILEKARHDALFAESQRLDALRSGQPAAPPAATVQQPPPAGTPPPAAGGAPDLSQYEGQTISQGGQRYKIVNGVPVLVQ
jgi:hypothetical protein